ncbi:type II toxin-antitoxin system RelE/ParE family toxin [Parvibaculum sp.]|uniref:type II toxin-antitoxin system RelE/ParE family toxin n=1 Tax=Parvibaculum sp. TaxID=2024848 RepID=UPI00320E37AE
MRIFKNKPFLRFARKEGVSDADLCEAIGRADDGHIDADLGGGVIKQRIARDGEGKSGGFRTIILFQKADRAFFVYGFAKKDRDNITKDELAAFRKLAQQMLAMNDSALKAAIKNQTITEVKCDG